MRNCLDCGAKLNDIDMKCTVCGSKNLSVIEADEKKVVNQKHVRILIYSAIAVVLAICIIVYGAFVVIRNTETRAIVQGVTAIISGDVEGYVSEYDEAFQETAREALLDEVDADEYKTEQIKALKETYGDDYEITVKAVDVSPAGEEFAAQFNEAYSDYGAQISEIKYVTVTTFIKGSRGENMDCKLVYAAKINGKWSLLELTVFPAISDEGEQQ